MLPGRRTDTGAIYVTQGPPPAGTPLVGGIAVSPAGVIYASQALVPVFDPSDLFASGEQGAWYDPSDLTTMFQDRAGTTPVTADGQTVGKILDKSGNGNHAVAPSDAARPLYKTDGTYHWLQFDGVDDSLSTAAINFTSTDKMSVFSGAYKNNDTVGIIAELSNGPINPGMFFLAVNDDLLDWSSLSRGTAAANPAQGASFSQAGAAKAVLFSSHDIAGDLTTLRKNTVAATDATGDKGTGNFGNYPLYIGARATTSLFLNGNIYSIIIRGAISTTQEITDTETWVNQKTGAY